MQIYDVWPIKIGPFLESGLVPLVLAPIWVLYGYLYPLLDEVFAEEESTELARERASSFPLLALTWVSAGAQFVLSDVLYLQGAPHWQVWCFLCLQRSALVWAALLAEAHFIPDKLYLSKYFHLMQSMLLLNAWLTNDDQLTTYIRQSPSSYTSCSW